MITCCHRATRRSTLPTLVWPPWHLGSSVRTGAVGVHRRIQVLARQHSAHLYLWRS